MGNSFAVIDKASKETLRLFKNNLILGSRVNRQFDKDFVRTPGKIGYTLRVRQPNKFVVRSGATFSANDLADPVSTITVQAQKGVDYLISYADLTMSVEEFTARYTAPAAQHLAAQADLEGYALYKQIANIVGTPGTQPDSTNAAKHMMQANAYITNQAAPIDDRHLITSTQIQVSYIDALKGLLNNQSAIGDQYKKGAFATGILGYDDIAASQSVNTHTAGNYSGTLQVNLAQGAATGATYQSGTLNIKGGANSVTGFFKAGDVITIAGCYDVNPLTKAPLPYLKRFAITADANTDGSENAVHRVEDGAQSVAQDNLVPASAKEDGRLACCVQDYRIRKRRDRLVVGIDWLWRRRADLVEPELPTRKDGIPCRREPLRGNERHHGGNHRCAFSAWR